MGRKKAVLTATHAVNHCDGVLYERVLAGSQTSKEGLDDEFYRRTYHHNSKHRTSYGEEYLGHGVVVFNNYEDECQVKRYPCKARREVLS